MILIEFKQIDRLFVIKKKSIINLLCIPEICTNELQMAKSKRTDYKYSLVAENILRTEQEQYVLQSRTVNNEPYQRWHFFSTMKSMRVCVYLAFMF